ncbi:MAG TPA: CHAT domain-containing protein [Kofleriaceae bacterium]|nr:CHAT domain-containing protein [Kofleriaceae bacterium]
MAALAAALAVALAGCDRGHDLRARCELAEAWIYTPIGPDLVLRVCGEAEQRTPNGQALSALAIAYVIKGDDDRVLALAAAAPDDPSSARVWHLAGEAEQRRDHRAAARAWFERTLAAQRDRDPLRAFNTADSLADLALLDDDVERALDLAHTGLEQAARSGEVGARMKSGTYLADLLLSLGDDRAAATTLDELRDIARDGAPFLQEYRLLRGDIEQRAHRLASASTMYAGCLDGAGFDLVLTQRCHLGLVHVDLARVANRDGTAGGDDLLADIERHLGAVDALEADVRTQYGTDPSRDGEHELLAIELALARGASASAADRLIALSRQPLGTSLRARVSTLLGEVLAERGRQDEAEVALQDATTAVEQLRDGAHYRETRAALDDELREPYEALFELRARRGNVPGALMAMERALTRDFIDQLAAEPTAATARTLDQAVAGAIERTALRRSLDLQAASASVASTAAPTSTVLAFFSARGRMWRVALRPGRPTSLEPIATLAELATTIDDARAQPGGSAAAALSARLLPAPALPPAGAPIVIVPDRALDGLRFAALRVGDRYLVELHPLVLAPTLRIATEPVRTAGAATAPVVLGDPTDDLPGALDEAREVAGTLGTAAFVREQATRDRLARAGRASVLHLASHGARSNGLSTLVLHDGEVTVGELLAMHLAPDLAVVASCVSAAQDHDAMWTSIAAALLASGARGVLGSAGLLPDDASHRMVTAFYRHGGARAPALALARTQRDEIAAGTAVDVWSMMVYFGSAESDAPAAALPRSNVVGGSP